MFKVKTNVKNDKGNFIEYTFREMQFDSYAYRRLFIDYTRQYTKEELMYKYGICERTFIKWSNYSNRYLAKYLDSNYPLLNIDWKKYN